MGKVIVLMVVVAVVVLLYLRSGQSNEDTLINKQNGEAFLEANRSLEGVIETASGLQYLVLHKGSGNTHPSQKDTVKVHYHGTLLNGTVFDSSVERNESISFGLNQVIKGWTEGLQLMVVGDKFRFFIPANLAYGNRSAGMISPGSTLIFEVELLGINL